jgi:hypothetical protein
VNASGYDLFEKQLRAELNKFVLGRRMGLRVEPSPPGVFDGCTVTITLTFSGAKLYAQRSVEEHQLNSCPRYLLVQYVVGEAMNHIACHRVEGPSDRAKGPPS